MNIVEKLPNMLIEEINRLRKNAIEKLDDPKKDWQKDWTPTNGTNSANSANSGHPRTNSGLIQDTHHFPCT